MTDQLTCGYTVVEGGDASAGQLPVKNLIAFQAGECPAFMVAESCGKTMEINTVTLINDEYDEYFADKADNEDREI